MEATLIKQDRKEIFWELTKSICPECKKVIDARILLRDGKVFINKRCPDHGPFEALFFGDADLYVQFGAPPTATGYQCRPYLQGNDETCTVPSTRAGEYHVMVRGYTSFTGVSLVASY